MIAFPIRTDGQYQTKISNEVETSNDSDGVSELCPARPTFLLLMTSHHDSKPQRAHMTALMGPKTTQREHEDLPCAETKGLAL